MAPVQEEASLVPDRNLWCWLACTRVSIPKPETLRPGHTPKCATNRFNQRVESVQTKPATPHLGVVVCSFFFVCVCCLCCVVLCFFVAWLFEFLFMFVVKTRPNPNPHPEKPSAPSSLSTEGSGAGRVHRGWRPLDRLQAWHPLCLKANHPAPFA